MFTARLLIALLMVVSSAGATYAQDGTPTFVWDNNLPNCGGSDTKLEPGAISCLVTYSDGHRRLTFHHKDIQLSMSHGWSREDLTIVVTAENAGDHRVPVDVKLWSLTGYKSIEDLIANRDPIFTSRAKKPHPIVNSSGMLDTGTIGLPNNSPVQREVTRNQTTNPSTGQILNPNTRVVVPNQTGSSTVWSTPNTGSRGKGHPSATKWTEVAARSTQIGEIRFPIDRGTTFVAVSFNINGTVYIYRLARRQR